MGMDGLSFSNTGAIKESTSADFTNRAEQIIQSDPTNNTKQVQTMSTNRRVKAKDEDEEGQSKQQEQPQNQASEEFEDGLIEPEEEQEEFNIEELENPNKDFYVKLNSKDDIIELYDSATDRLIETISGNELRELVRKLNMASGIFVNKKV